MKPLSFLFVLLLAAFSGQAQELASETPGTGKSSAKTEMATSSPNPRIVYADPYSTDHTQMELQGNILSFQNLPKTSLKIHITNGSGREVAVKSLSIKKNTVDISRLENGIHFVTLISENNGSRKTFSFTKE